MVNLIEVGHFGMASSYSPTGGPQRTMVTAVPVLRLRDPADLSSSRLKFVLLGLLLTTHDQKGQIVGLLQTLPKAYPVLNTFGD